MGRAEKRQVGNPQNHDLKLQTMTKEAGTAAGKIQLYSNARCGRWNIIVIMMLVLVTSNFVSCQAKPLQNPNQADRW